MARNPGDVPIQFVAPPELAADIKTYIGRGELSRVVRRLLTEEVQRRRAARPVLVDRTGKETAA